MDRSTKVGGRSGSKRPSHSGNLYTCSLSRPKVDEDLGGRHTGTYSRLGRDLGSTEQKFYSCLNPITDRVSSRVTHHLDGSSPLRPPLSGHGPGVSHPSSSSSVTSSTLSRYRGDVGPMGRTTYRGISTRPAPPRHPHRRWSHKQKRDFSGGPRTRVEKGRPCEDGRNGGQDRLPDKDGGNGGRV